MTPRRDGALVVGHADGDGHLAAEQSRRNLLSAGFARVDVLVDPRITAGHRFWDRYLGGLALGDADLIVFVDLMFSPSDPVASFEALSRRARSEPGRRFKVVDHHPVTDLPPTPPNLSIEFTREVFRCCQGKPSELMLIASVCDRDEAPVEHLLSDHHRRMAVGVQRAAADRHGLAGRGLLRLLRQNRWDVLGQLADDASEFHRRVRGVRPQSLPPSAALEQARSAAWLA